MKENSLARKYPRIAKEADGWDPKLVSSGSDKKLNWVCSKNKKHKWVARVADRTRKSSKCPYCAGTKVLQGENDLFTKFPKIAKEADGWNPKLVLPGSHSKLKWKCKKNNEHKWLATPKGRTGRGDKCPFCSNKRVHKGTNDIATKFPKIAKEADGWDPTKVLAGSHKKLRWKCQKNPKHMWVVSPHDRLYGGTLKKPITGCPYCDGKRVLAGSNDLATAFPMLAKEADGWDPKKVSPHSNRQLKWKCKENSTHIWKTSPNHRTLRGDRCPFCFNKKIKKGENDLKTTHPNIALEADGWDPTKYVAGSSARKAWKCSVSSKHKWFATIGGRALRGDGCPICSNRVVLEGFNDLLTTHPELSKESYGWNPKKYTAGYGKKLKWRCSEDPNHIWVATVANRSRGSGCPTCSISGFDPNLDGFLYFIEHPVWFMFQIGITNYPADRLSSHKKLGWTIVEIRGPMDGHSTRDWETAILRMLRAKGADLANKKIAGKFDGYTEAWSKSTYKVSSIKELMDLTEEFEASI